MTKWQSHMGRTVDTCIVLIAVALTCILFGILSYTPKPIVYTGFSSRDFHVELPASRRVTPTPTPTPNPVLNTVSSEIWSLMEDIPLTDRIMRMESIGYYYITAYCNCSKCCGVYANGRTASGTECHYESDSYAGTTCAIDRSLHHFGEMLYIPSEDRVYITEDTGSAVLGRHIDIYFPDHSYVERYGSHTEEVFRVWYEDCLVQANNYDVRKYINRQFWPSQLQDNNLIYRI